MVKKRVLKARIESVEEPTENPPETKEEINARFDEYEIAARIVYQNKIADMHRWLASKIEELRHERQEALEVAYLRPYAEALGKEVHKLTPEERREAFLRQTVVERASQPMKENKMHSSSEQA